MSDRSSGKSSEHAAQTSLATAAPSLAAALCLVEWHVMASGFKASCPVCLGSAEGRFHHRGCALDEALTAAGIDAAARDRIRDRHTEIDQAATPSTVTRRKP